MVHIESGVCRDNRDRKTDTGDGLLGRLFTALLDTLGLALARSGLRGW